MRQRKQKKLALLLTFCMVLGMVPIPVLAEEAHTHSDSGTAITFEAWTATDSLPTTAGNYYLTADVSISSTWSVPSGTTSLDLNGHSITMTGSKTVITVDDTTFNLYDCQGTGKITGGKGSSATTKNSAGGVSVGGNSKSSANETFNMYGGNITGNSAGGYGGGIMIFTSSTSKGTATFNMYGGAISDNTAYQSGGVQNQGTFNMYGGTISGNKADNSGGAVTNYQGSVMTMSGEAAITGNEAEQYSGGITVDREVEFTMSDNATIAENTTEGYGGGIYNVGGFITMSDNASIRNNSATGGGGGILNAPGWEEDNNKNITYYYGKVTMSGKASVTGNTTEGYGAGIVNSGNILVMSGNALIAENSADAFSGGVYNSGTMEMSGNAAVTNNSAKQYGAGIFNYDTLKMSGNATVTENTAELYGGGIFNIGEIILGGAIKISENKAGDSASNLVLAERGIEYNGTHYQTDYSVTIESPLTNTTPIGVSAWSASSNPYIIEEADTGSKSANDEVVGVGVDGNDVIGGWVVTSSGYKTNNGGAAADKYFTSEDPNRILLISKEGEVYLVLHTHTWEYTSSGDTVTAKCVTDDNLSCKYREGVDLKISAEDMDYSGEQYFGADITNSITGVTGAEVGDIYYEGIGSTTYESVTTPPTAIGTYKATVVIGGETATAEFKIKDVTPPVGEISVSTNGWGTFIDNVVFELFYKNTEKVTITGEDVNNGSGLNKIYYYVASEKMTLDEVKNMADSQWTEYKDSFYINPDNEYVIYSKITDNAGNVTYISSDGIVLDKTSPIISGVQDGQVYYGDTTFKVTDKYFDSVTVDGKEVNLTDGGYTITADNNEHTIVAKDKAGNVTEYKIKVYKIYTVTFVADGKTIATEKVKYGFDVQKMPEIPAKEGFDKTAPVWDGDGRNITEDTTITAIYTKNDSGKYHDVTPKDNVGGGTLDNDVDELKTVVPFTPEELEKIEKGEDVDIWLELKDISDKISDEDKQSFEEELLDFVIPLYMDLNLFKQVGDDDAQEVTELNGKVTVKFVVPDEYINKDSNVERTYEVIGIHEDGIELLDSEFDEDTNIMTIETDCLLTCALAYADKAVDTPGTGDNSNMHLWLILLVGSGLTAVGFWKKKKCIVEE